MTTYSVPFKRAGKFAGILSIDISIEDYAQVLRGWLGELQMADDAYGFVVDQTGKIVTHPRKDLFRSEVAALEPELAGRIKGELQGVVVGIDPRTKAPASFVFARVPASNWTFVAVVPHPKR